MSGILAVAHFDGRPIDRAGFDQLVQTMAFRGPEATACWHDGSVALGITACATGRPGEAQRQPVSLDGSVWMLADARLDDRPALCASLTAAGRRPSPDAADVRLLLEAYHAWGEDAFRRLIGDFACIIWNQHARRLLAVRDPIGVRPLYTATWRGGVVVSNTLCTVLAHAKIPATEDRQAIADFLLFDTLQDPQATPFDAVRQIPPAHLRAFDSDHSHPARRYWSFDDLDTSDLPPQPAAGRLPTAHQTRDWLEAFKQRLHSAVAARVAEDHRAVLMSGGLDSTAVAILAQQTLSARDPSLRLDLDTVVFDPLIEDQEGHYAAQVAAALGAHHRLHRLGSHKLFADWDELVPGPLLADRSLEASARGIDRTIASRSRVVLTGLGGDPALAPDVGYFVRQLKSLSLLRAWRYLRRAPRRSDRRLPPLGLGVWWGLGRQRRVWQRSFPEWLAPELTRDLNLEQQWQEAGLKRLRIETERRRLYAEGFGPAWSSAFEQVDAGDRGLPLEQRHPFFDLRLIALVTQLPAVPCCVEKDLLRQAMRGRMPEQVRLRPKRGLPRLPALRPATVGSGIWKSWMRGLPDVRYYVDVSKVLGALEADESAAAGATVAYRWHNRRPLNLGLWMRRWGAAGTQAVKRRQPVGGGGR